MNRKDLNRIVDGLGKGLDKEIMQTVFELSRLGFYTTGSCAGHVARGMIGPWVDIQTKEYNELYDREIQSVFDKHYKLGEITEEEAWENHKVKQGEKFFKNLRAGVAEEGKRLEKLLNDFYQTEKAEGQKLCVNYGILGVSRLEAKGNEMAKDIPKVTRLPLHNEMAVAMRRFTNYLQTLKS